MHTFRPWENIRKSEHMEQFRSAPQICNFPTWQVLGEVSLKGEEVVMANWILFLKL